MRFEIFALGKVLKLSQLPTKMRFLYRIMNKT